MPLYQITGGIDFSYYTGVHPWLFGSKFIQFHTVFELTSSFLVTLPKLEILDPPLKALADPLSVPIL